MELHKNNLQCLFESNNLCIVTTPRHMSIWIAQPRQRWCHYWEVQDQPFAFSWRFGDAGARILCTDPSTRTFNGLQLCTTKHKRMSALKWPTCYLVRFETLKVKYAASKRACTAKVKEWKHVWVVFDSGGRRNKGVDTRTSKAKAILRELCRSMVTKRKLSNITKLSVARSNWSLFRYSTIRWFVLMSCHAYLGRFLGACCW